MPRATGWRDPAGRGTLATATAVRRREPVEVRVTAIEEWLAEGDAPEADWGARLVGLAARGDLGSAGDLWLDLPALAQPYACVSRACTPGRRAARARSCCADLDVGVTRSELAAVHRAMPEIAAWMAPRDPRWAHGPPVAPADPLPRPGRRCLFAIDRGGLRCGLHELEDATGRPRGALKPMPCRLFPLVVVDLGDGLLLSAIHARTARLVESYPARSFPCLLDPGRRPLVHGVRDTIVALWGPGRYRRIREQVAAWRRDQIPPK